MEELKMAACGIDCNNCDSYIVTKNQDLKAAEHIVEWYRNQGWIDKSEGAEAVVKKAPLCNGCWNSNKDCFFKCGCYMLKCCKEKQINHCAECDDFPCDEYKQFASGYEGHRKAMEKLLSLKKEL